MNRKLKRLLVFVIIFAMLISAEASMFANVVAQAQEADNEVINEEAEDVEEAVDLEEPVVLGELEEEAEAVEEEEPKEKAEEDELEEDPESQEQPEEEPKVEEPEEEPEPQEEPTEEAKAEDEAEEDEPEPQEQPKEIKESPDEIGDEDVEEMVGDSKDDNNGLAEYFPSVLEPPIILADHYFQNRMFNLMSSGLEDTIEVDKAAERTKDEGGNCVGCRTFEVTLGITGRPQQAPVDVVLVLDRSGSMSEVASQENDYFPIVETPSTSSSYYVKVGGQYRQVSYSSGFIFNPRGWYYSSGLSRYYVEWDPNGDDNLAGGNSNNPTAKPFYVRGKTRLHHAKEAAINFAAKVLGPDGIPGSRVSIVSYSGPSTTSGYGNQDQASTDIGLTSDLTQVVNAINGLNAVGGTNTQAGFIQGKGVIENSDNPNSNKVVIMFTDGLPTASNGNIYAETTNSNHVHVTTAIAAGRSIFEGNITDVFTIGLLQGMSGAELNLARNILNQTQNKGFYEAPSAEDLNSIFTTISQQLAYSATNAKVVDKIGNNFNLIEDSLPEGVTYNPVTRVITWSPGTIVENAELKYIVQAKSEFEGGLADTNEYAKLTYTDVFGASGKEKVFPVPKVDVPTKLAVSLTDATVVLGESINLGDYINEITGGDGDGNYTYEWRIKGEEGVYSTEENPSFTPVDDEDTTFLLIVTDSNGCKSTAEMVVRVTLPDVSVTIRKVVEGNMGDFDFEFPFTVEVTDGETFNFSLAHDQTEELKVPINAVLTLRETNLNGHTIKSVTVGGNPITNNQDASYTITLADQDIEIIVTNENEVEIDTGITLDSLPYILILAGATLGLGVKFVGKRKED